MVKKYVPILMDHSEARKILCKETEEVFSNLLWTDSRIKDDTTHISVLKDRRVVVVFGKTGVGKSTLINALI